MRNKTGSLPRFGGDTRYGHGGLAGVHARYALEGVSLRGHGTRSRQGRAQPHGLTKVSGWATPSIVHQSTFLQARKHSPAPQSCVALTTFPTSVERRFGAKYLMLAITINSLSHAQGQTGGVWKTCSVGRRKWTVFQSTCSVNSMQLQ